MIKEIFNFFQKVFYALSFLLKNAFFFRRTHNMYHINYIIISNFVIVPSIILLKFNHLVERQIALMRFALLLHVA